MRCRTSKALRGAKGARGAKGERRSLATWLVRERIAAVVAMVAVTGALALVVSRDATAPASIQTMSEPVDAFELTAADSPVASAAPSPSREREGARAARVTVPVAAPSPAQELAAIVRRIPRRRPLRKTSRRSPSPRRISFGPRCALTTRRVRSRWPRVRARRFNLLQLKANRQWPMHCPLVAPAPTPRHASLSLPPRKRDCAVSPALLPVQTRACSRTSA